MYCSRFFLNQLERCSSSYKNISKLSLKVYYFQEISKIVADRNNTPVLNYEGDYKRNVYPIDHHTFNDSDLKQLSVDIDKSVYQLSPTQLLSTAISYSNIAVVGRKEWKRLCSAVLRHVYGNLYNINVVSPSHLSMILYSYAKRFNNQMPVTYKLLKSSVKTTGSLNERDISMLLYYMRRTKSVPKSLNSEDHLKNAQILRSIALCLSREGGNKLERLSPSGLVSVIYNFSQIGMIPWSMIYHACNLVKRKADKLDFKSVGFHSRSLSMLNIRDKKTLEKFLLRLSGNKPIPLATLSSILYSLAKLKYRPKSDLKFFLDEIRRSIPFFEDRDVALVVYSLGQLGIRSEEIFESVTSFLKERIEHQSPQHLSMLIRGYSKVGIYDRTAIDLLVESSSNLLSGFTLPQIVSVVDSLVVLGHFDESHFSRFLDYVCSFPSEDVPEYCVNQLNRIMFSLRLEQPGFRDRTTAFIRSLIDRYQGHFMIIENREQEDSLLRSLREIGIDFRTGERVGMYFPDAVLERNVSLEMLSQGSVCPVTGSVLGSPRMQKRHMEAMGYHHIQITKNDWIKSSDSQRQKMLVELLSHPYGELV